MREGIGIGDALGVLTTPDIPIPPAEHTVRTEERPPGRDLPRRDDSADRDCRDDDKAVFVEEGADGTSGARQC